MWQQIVITLVINLALSALNRPKYQNAKPSGLDEFKLPTAEVGREIPVLFGTRKITGANVVWYGDLSNTAITEKVSSGGLFSKSKSVTVGYQYYLGVHFVLTHGPSDKITRIDFEDKTAWTGSVTSGTFTVSASTLFGGKDREGGVSGTVEFLPGTFTQSRSSYLESKLGSDSPAFRGVTSVVFRQLYIGNSTYMKTPAFWILRIPQGWYAAKATIGGNAANPAHILYEVLTNKEWGLGYSTADIDSTTFTAAADTLYTEGFGLSLLWDKSKAVNEFIKDVLQHINASLYVSKTDGKFKLKLIRAYYSIPALTVLDESNITIITQFKRQSNEELSSSVSVVFWDVSTGKENSVTVQDTALATQQGAARRVTNQYPGISNPTLAATIAARDLKTVSTPLASCIIQCDYSAFTLNVGDAFVLNWARYGVANAIFRVGEIDYGTLENNQITIKATEDVFGYQALTYTPPSGTAWVNPVSAPTAITDQFIYEATYLEQLLQDGAADDAENYVLVAATKPTSDSLNANLFYYDGANYIAYGDPLTFCPYATIVSDQKPETTTMTISGAVDTDLVAVGSYALIVSSGNYGGYNREFVKINAVSSTSITIGRGVIDTTPVSIAAGSKIYFLSDFVATDARNYATSATAQIKLLTVTGLGVLPIASATALSQVLANRVAKPYPPAKLTINTQTYPLTVSTPGNSPPATVIDVAWEHRNRIDQGTTLVDTTATGYTAEAGTTYDVVLLKAGTPVQSALGLTGTSTSFTVLVADEYTVTVTANRDGLSSHTPLFWTFDVEII